MTSMIAAVLSEATEHNATPEPLLIGGAAFGGLLLALFIVTRFNKDR
jgi:hypothetical protein